MYQETVFEPLVSYFQEENWVSERMGRTIIEIVQVTIIEKQIKDT